MTFGQSISSFFRNYAGFSGRAQRSEYWFAVLFLFLVSLPLTIVDVALFGDVVLEAGLGPITVVFLLGVFLPALALSVRRLHDVGMSGWLVLLYLIPFAGFIFSLVVSLLDSKRGANQWGPSAKYPDGTEAPISASSVTVSSTPPATAPVQPVVLVGETRSAKERTPAEAPSLPPIGSGGISTTDQLSRLAELHEQGKLTDREFVQAKAKLLG